MNLLNYSTPRVSIAQTKHSIVEKESMKIKMFDFKKGYFICVCVIIRSIRAVSPKVIGWWDILRAVSPKVIGWWDILGGFFLFESSSLSWKNFKIFDLGFPHCLFQTLLSTFVGYNKSFPTSLTHSNSTIQSYFN